MSYTVFLFKDGNITEIRIWAESMEVALQNAATLRRANRCDECILRREGNI